MDVITGRHEHMKVAASNKINPSGREEWRENWPVVAAAMVGYAISVIHLYSLGVMIAPLEAEFGWSRSLITSGYMIVATVVFLLSPLVGIAIDRFGPRRIARCGIIIYCLSLALLSLTQQAIWTWWLLWLFVALGVMFLKPTVWVAAISSLFRVSRGAAIAIALSASGIVSSGGPLLTHFLVENVGWRLAYASLAVIAAVVAVPVIFLFFSSAKDRSRINLQAVTGPAQPSPAHRRSTILKAFKSRAFSRLTVVSFIMSMLISALIVGLVPIMTFNGLDRASAAAIAGIVGISQIVGRLIGGLLLDRFNARVVSATVVIFPVITCLSYIMFAGSLPFAIIAALVFGLSVGAELDTIAYLASRYFGVDNFGTLFGTMIGLTALGGGLGPFLSSRIYDLTGSYIPVLWALIPLSLISAYLLLTLGPYPESEGKVKPRG